MIYLNFKCQYNTCLIFFDVSGFYVLRAAELTPQNFWMMALKRKCELFNVHVLRVYMIQARDQTKLGEIWYEHKWNFTNTHLKENLINCDIRLDTAILLSSYCTKTSFYYF